jgi:hypothetical protein
MYSFCSLMNVELGKFRFANIYRARIVNVTDKLIELSAWIARKNLRQLGENAELDELMQSPLATYKAGVNKLTHSNQAAQRVRFFKV